MFNFTKNAYICSIREEKMLSQNPRTPRKLCSSINRISRKNVSTQSLSIHGIIVDVPQLAKVKKGPFTVSKLVWWVCIIAVDSFERISLFNEGKVFKLGSGGARCWVSFPLWIIPLFQFVVLRERVGRWHQPPGDNRFRGKKYRIGWCRERFGDAALREREWLKLVLDGPSTVVHCCWAADMQQDHPNDPEQNQKEADWSPVQKGRRRSRKKLPITPQGIKPYISGMSGVTITYKTIEKKATETREEESSPPMGKETHQAVGDDQNQLLPKEGQSSQKKSEDTSIPDMEAEIQPATNLSPTDEEEYVEAEEDLEAVYENDEAAGEDLEAIMEDGDVGMEDDENDGEEELGEDLSLMAAVQPAGPIKPPTDSMSNLAIVAHTISTSDSLKRKGEEDGGEDTASSKLKRSKLSKFP